MVLVEVGELVVDIDRGDHGLGDVDADPLVAPHACRGVPAPGGPGGQGIKGLVQSKRG